MSENRPPPRRRIAGESTTPAPAKKAPVKKAPAKKAPAKKAPAKKASTAQAAASTTAKKAPAKKAPVKKAPVAKAPVASPASEPEVVEASRPQVARPAARTRSSGSGERGSERDTRTLVVAAVASLVLVAGAVVGWFGLENWRGESADDARSEAVSVASKATETIFSFSYDKLDEHTTESKAFMTPSYAKEFDTIAPALTDIAPERKVSVEAVTRNAAVLPCGDECSPNRASVLVFVDQDRRIAGEDSSTVFGNRIEVDLRKTDGDWKVNDIRAL